MGKIKQGILGGFSGKVANVVGSSWKGIAYMKALPLSVANPQTAGQVAQRTKLSNTVAFAKVILASIIKPLRDRFAVQQSGYNTFVSDNIALFAAANPAPAADLILSSGKMAATAFENITTFAANSDVDVSWVDDSGEGFKLSSDECYVVILNETQGVIGFNGGEGIREDVAVTVEMPANLVALDVIHGWMSFLRADGTIVSNSSYMTVGTPNP